MKAMPKLFITSLFTLSIFFSYTFLFTAKAAELFWTDYGSDKIQKSNLDGTNQQDLITTGLSFAVGLNVDVTAGKMYWIDPGTQLLERSNLDGTNRETVKSSYTGGYDVAVLPTTTNNLYTYIGSGGYTIQRGDLKINPTLTTIVSDTANFQGGGLDFDFANNKMYWVATGSGVKTLNRANLDGSSVEVLNNTLSNPLDVAVDSANGKVYWTDTGKIQRSNLDGTTVEDVITGLSGPQGITIDASGGKIYWTEAGSGKLRRANLDGTSPEDIITGLTTPWKLAITPDSNTPTGTDVEVVTGGFSLTLGTVSSTGLTQILEGSAADEASLLSDQMVGAILPSTLVDISTTATVSGTHMIQITYDESEIPVGFLESELRLFHDTGFGVEDITTSVDTVNNIITGETTSFSPFAVGVNPEPATLLLLGSSLIGLLRFRRK